MNIALLFITATAVIAAGFAAVLDVSQNNVADKKSDPTYQVAGYISDDKNGVDPNIEIDGIQLKYLTEEELHQLLEEEDGKLTYELDLFAAAKEVKSRHGPSTPVRRKRWITLAGRALFTAGRALFRGAARARKPTVSGSRITRNYNKRGNFQDAVRDFNRFKVNNPSSFSKNGISGRTGTVGRHRITVRDGSKGNSRPTIEIRTPKNNGEYVRKFRYNQ